MRKIILFFFIIDNYHFITLICQQVLRLWIVLGLTEIINLLIAGFQNTKSQYLPKLRILKLDA
jgi:hypothetical protein